LNSRGTTLQFKTETYVGIFIVGAIGVFIYMGFQIGSFRFDRDNYRPFVIYFKDISGLSRKADVKIAGVKVGWVEEIKLLTDETVMAQAKVMVERDYILYENASGLVRRDGLLGVMYLEINPGDPLLKPLSDGEALQKPSRTPADIDEILHKFKKIASNVEEVSETFRDAMGGAQASENLREIFTNLKNVTNRMATVTDILERSFTRNEDNIDKILEIGKEFKRLSDSLTDEVLPSLKDGIENIAQSFARDFNKVTSKIESTISAFEDASIEARDGLRKFGSVAEKLDEGRGLLGKLINEDETYRDLRTAVSGLKNYFAKIDRLQIVFDAHSERMYRPSENYTFEDSKGYFDIRIHPNEDYFYLIQLASSEKGFVSREEIRSKFFDANGCEIKDGSLKLFGSDDVRLVPRVETELIKRDAFRFGLQFGKIYKDLAFRFGLFDGTVGFGVDFDIPFKTEKLRWVTSLEIFDMNGRLRLDGDRRPHLKWLNRVFFLKNLYMTFGADDFVSKHNANAFFGAGIRFGDDDVKYFISKFGGGGFGN